MRSNELYLKDILDSIKKIYNYIDDKNFNTFRNHEMMKDAVLRNLEIIGEASNNISDSLKKKYQNILWSEIIGLRNIVVHDYFGVDLNIIWEIIKKDLPEFEKQIQEILKKEFNNTSD